MIDYARQIIVDQLDSHFSVSEYHINIVNNLNLLLLNLSSHTSSPIQQSSIEFVKLQLAVYDQNT